MVVGNIISSTSLFDYSLLGPATTSISQHQQNWPGRIISFILGRYICWEINKLLVSFSLFRKLEGIHNG
ncbi:hypothetical protein ACB092_11G127800 [Castanea dentata]